MIKRLLLFFPIVISICYAIVLGIIVSPGFLNVHDSPLLHFRHEIGSIQYFWNDNNFGYTNYLLYSMSFYPLIWSSIMLNLGISTLSMQLIYYVVIISSIFYSSWFAISKTLKLIDINNGFYYSFIGAIFYTTNLYMVASLHGGTINGLFLCYSMTPLVLWKLHKILLSKFMNIDILHLGIFLTFAINTVPFFLAMIICFIIPLGFIMHLKRKLTITIKNLSQSFLISLFLSSPLLIPFLLAFFGSDPTPIHDNSSNYMFANYGIFGYLRFFYDWTMNQWWSGKYFQSYYPIVNNKFVIISSIVLWIIPISSTILAKRKLIKITSAYLLIILCFGIFLAKGNQEPFGIINNTLYKLIPGFNIFRTPDTKFGLAVITAFSFLLGIGLSQIKYSFVKIFFVLILIAQSTIYFLPNTLIETNSSSSFDRIVEIPEEYTQIVNIINNDIRDGMVLIYPGYSYANFRVRERSGISGQDILGKMISAPKFYSDGFVFGKSKELYESLTDKMSATNLAQYSVKYVVLRKDLELMNQESLQQNLIEDPQSKLVAENNLLILFRIENPHPILFQVDKLGSIQYFSYSKISQTLYTIELSDTSENDVVLNNSYHPGWYIWSSNNPFIIQQSKKYNDFANSWENSQVRKGTNYLIYLPQYIYEIYLVCFTLLLLTIVIFRRKLGRFWSKCNNYTDNSYPNQN